MLNGGGGWSLSVQERDIAMTALNENQREYLANYLVRSRRTAFVNAMAREKGYHVPEDAEPDEIEKLLEDWIYTGYIDAGEVTPELRCECGRPLRYQHQVEHKATGEVKRFGIEHLKEHLGIDASMVAAIKKGLDAIDYELDDVMRKVMTGWQPDPELLAREDIPLAIAAQLQAGLPLLERQLNRLRQSKARRAAPSQPANTVTPRREAPAVDLFSWNEPPEASDAVGKELEERYKHPVRTYLKEGVRSARVLCELLIRDHGASRVRYLTGKPQIYIPVCRYIEASYPDMSVEDNHRIDRIYTFQD